MPIAITVDARSERRVAKLLDSLSGRELVNRTRRATRAGAAVFRDQVRANARSGKYPRSFRRTRTKTSTHGGIRTSTGPTSPLVNIFEGGADDHPIGAPGQLLHSQQGEPLFAAHGPVKHPGMDARPIIKPTFEQAKSKASAAAMAELVKGLG